MKTIGIIGAMSEEVTYLKEKIEIVTTKNRVTNRVIVSIIDSKL